MQNSAVSSSNKMSEAGCGCLHTFDAALDGPVRTGWCLFGEGGEDEEEVGKFTGIYTFAGNWQAITIRIKIVGDLGGGGNKCPPSDERRIAEQDRDRGLRQSLNFRRPIGEGGRRSRLRSGASSGDDGNHVPQGLRQGPANSGVTLERKSSTNFLGPRGWPWIVIARERSRRS